MKFTKEIISHNEFYLSTFTLSEDLPYILFIHGGPAFNSATVEKMVEEYNLFDKLNANLVFYDQRACGRSPRLGSVVTHNDNVNDLYNIFNFLKTQNIVIKLFMGHSYGAKLLNDFYMRYSSINIPGVFVAVAESMLTPRLNNLMLDLGYLKMEKPEEYKQILSKLEDDISLSSIWKLTEELAPLFNQNKSRPYFYWANLEWFDKDQKIKAEHKLTANQDVFMSVRKDIHETETGLSINIDSLPIKSLWINGFHDYIMSGASGIVKKNINPQKKSMVFSKSAHYPHIEENEKFCEVINDFIK